MKYVFLSLASATLIASCTDVPNFSGRQSPVIASRSSLVDATIPIVIGPPSKTYRAANYASISSSQRVFVDIDKMGRVTIYSGGKPEAFANATPVRQKSKAIPRPIRKPKPKTKTTQTNVASPSPSQPQKTDMERARELAGQNTPSVMENATSRAENTAPTNASLSTEINKTRPVSRAERGMERVVVEENVQTASRALDEKPEIDRGLMLVDIDRTADAVDLIKDLAELMDYEVSVSGTPEFIPLSITTTQEPLFGVLTRTINMAEKKLDIRRDDGRKSIEIAYKE